MVDAMTLIASAQPLCRHCHTPLELVFADLGETPIANDYLDEVALDRPEPRYPLKAFVCTVCHLVQVQDCLPAQALFRADYAYRSSMSSSWLAHAQIFATLMTERFALSPESHIIEVGSNDGYLLQYFQDAKCRVTGIEPCTEVADIARKTHQIPTLEVFLSEATARHIIAERGRADLVIANNVLAHVPAINDFVKGLAILVKLNGVLSLEFPHLLNLIRLGQFDTIYHEHFSYLSLLSVERILGSAGLRVFDVEELPTHGGSLRVLACHDDAPYAEEARVAAMRMTEHEAELDTETPYRGFQNRIDATIRELKHLLESLKASGKTISAYGAPAKGNTLLNSAGLDRNVIDFTVDKSPSKQGRYLPGSHIPILAPSAINDERPDYIMILPWNIADEIAQELRAFSEWHGHLIIPIPHPRLFDR
jgi:SAM-dependent methyltransferase